METFLIYLGKTAVSTAAFYLAFIVLFKNQKHFIFNRVYLPFSFLTGFIIPLFTFTTVKYIELTNSPAVTVQIHSNLTPVISESAEFVFQWYHYLSGIYILGYIGFLLYLIYGYLKAQNIINNCERRTLFDSEVYITKKDVHPFSFFNKIVLPEKSLENPKLDMIISHEKIHVIERHTLDIIFAEILFLFQWFNPFAWLIKDAIKSNLEYKTDDELAKQYNPEQYQLTMVGLAHKKDISPFLTGLNGSRLKNRLIMMKKKTENKYALLKQLLVLPLLAILVMCLSEKEEKTEIIQEKAQPKIEKVKKDIIVGRVYDEYGYIVNGAEIAEYDTLGRVIGGVYSKNGVFILEVRQNLENVTIRCSHNEYKTKEVVVDLKEKKEIIFRLTPLKAENYKRNIIHGQVFNENGRIVPGANITEYDNLGRVVSGTVSNMYGDFNLELTQNLEKATIECSHKEYKTKVAVVDSNEKKAVIFWLFRKESAPQ